MTGLLFLAALVVICAGILATDRWMDRRPAFYRGRHRRRWLPNSMRVEFEFHLFSRRMRRPSRNHPAWLNMRRVDGTRAEEDDEVIAAMEAMLEEEDHR